MDTLKAFALGELNRGNEMRVFDWDKAASLIKSKDCKYASAGLIEDWEWTGGCIFKDGEPELDDYTFLSSNWATPTLVMDGIEYECFKMESEVPDWGSGTKWPKSALKILLNNK